MNLWLWTIVTYILIAFIPTNENKQESQEEDQEEEDINPQQQNPRQWAEELRIHHFLPDADVKFLHDEHPVQRLKSCANADLASGKDLKSAKCKI
ncbi:hypothetical protein FQA39_LY08286 [Lamprigera yunnana]|nr:hypothetical protein FQA39_LY08286 [Lamprigera yunnana]